MTDHIVKGPLLIPSEDGGVAYHADGALAYDASGILVFAGPWKKLQSELPKDSPRPRVSDGVMLPPLLDLHTHIPQHPIRGRFAEGVSPDAPGGVLLNGLKRNVFPAETKCNARDYARKVIEAFLADTRANGIVGGAAFMTVSAAATEIALEILPDTWSVGLVMMNQNCPDDLRSDEKNVEADIIRLATQFGRRFIVTDRFAVAVNSSLRRVGSNLAKRFGLRTQTHLNEQLAEKHFVENKLYPDADSYTDVYLRDGLLQQECILAHCIHMRPEEWRMVTDAGAVIAHCPTSNLMLASGVMPLDEVRRHKIPFAIATDVGASPTVSMLAEMRRFLDVHAGRSMVTPGEALFRATLAPARILGLDEQVGRLDVGRPASFIEAAPVRPLSPGESADDVILALLPEDPDNPPPTVARVTLNGKAAFQRSRHHA